MGDLTEFKSVFTNESLPLVEQQGLAQAYAVAGTFNIAASDSMNETLKLASEPQEDVAEVFFSDDFKTAFLQSIPKTNHCVRTQ